MMFYRRQVITHRKVQLKLASVFLLWFGVFIAFFSFIFFVNFAMSSSRTEGMVIHDQLMTKMILVQQTKDLAVWYGLAAIGYLLLAGTYLIIYSHRLTGPVFKLTKALEKASKSNTLPGNIRFRKADAFSELATAFNEFVEKVRNGEFDTHKK